MTQESTNPAVSKGTGKEQWQAKHMSSVRDMAKLLPPHTCYLNSLGNWFLFRQVILQQDKVSKDWGPAGNVDSQDKTQKQSYTSKEGDYNTIAFGYNYILVLYNDTTKHVHASIENSLPIYLLDLLGLSTLSFAGP